MHIFPIEKIIDDLEALRDLQPNWDSYGARQISGEIIDVAIKFVKILPVHIPPPRVVPMSQGRLQLEWHKKSCSLELEFTTKNDISYLKWNELTEWYSEGNGPMSEKEILELIGWFDEN